MINNPTKVYGLQVEREEGYVIAGNHVVWCGRSVHDFRDSALDAVRFARQCDAERVLCWILPEEYRRVCGVRHHTWVPDSD